MAKTGLGIDFPTKLSAELIASRGSQMFHEIALSCPSCNTSDPHMALLKEGLQLDPNCAKCGGAGELFRDPKVVLGLATSIKKTTQVSSDGWANPGDMTFSLGTEFLKLNGGRRRVGRNDKFTALWAQVVDDGQTIVRGAATLGDNIRFSNNVQSLEDRLWYEPESSIWCEDENEVVYHQDSDFVLGPGRIIKWVGNTPAVRTKYVLKYSAYFEWIAWNPADDRVDRGNKHVGPLVHLRKKHVVNINESPVIEDADKLSVFSRVEC